MLVDVLQIRTLLLCVFSNVIPIRIGTLKIVSVCQRPLDAEARRLNLAAHCDTCSRMSGPVDDFGRGGLGNLIG